MRRVYLKMFSSARMPHYRVNYVHPVMHYNIDRFASERRAELFAQLTEVTPIRVILSLCGLPWRDDSFISRYMEIQKVLNTWIAMGHPDDDEMTRKAKAVSEESAEMLRPYVLERRDGRGDDLISQVWALAPEHYGKVGLDDVLAVTRDMISAAGHTTVHALTNLIYLFLHAPVLREAVTQIVWTA